MDSTTKNENSFSFLDRNFFWKFTPALIILIGLIFLSTFFHLINIDSIGDANQYYTAAVESMLHSWENFFFVAAEPGGSVTVDKPPLGLWIEAIFAYFFGVSGIVVSLPNIIAGILSVPLLYYLVKKYFGTLAGLISSLALIITPVALAADRNNTMDGMLTFVLILAAWSFMEAVDTGKFRYLLVGAVIVGLGFNIKMLQAFLPLPAFLALYFLAARKSWWKKLLNLVIAACILLVVSLSWAVIVDSIPPDQRPYIGSSSDNTVMELILGHNGAARLFGHTRSNIPNINENSQGPSSQQTGEIQQQIASNQPSQQDDRQTDGNTQFSQETGLPGVFRFLKLPLAKEMSWLLIFGLFGIIVSVILSPIHLPIESNILKGTILWGGWLITCLVFFSVANFFHAYYMILLAPPLGAVVGAGVSGGLTLIYRKSWFKWILFAVITLTLLFQIQISGQLSSDFTWILFSILLLILGFSFLLSSNIWVSKNYLLKYGVSVALLSILVIPFIWSLLTVMDPAPHSGLPAAYSGDLSTEKNSPRKVISENRALPILEFLQRNTQDIEYLVAVPSANDGASFVINTGRPVLYLGGFSGGDPVVTINDLVEMVANKEIKYILYRVQGRGSKQEISKWLWISCRPIPKFSPGLMPPDANMPNFVSKLKVKNDGLILFECGK